MATADPPTPRSSTGSAPAPRVKQALVNNGGFAWFGDSEALDAATYDSMFVEGGRTAIRAELTP